MSPLAQRILSQGALAAVLLGAIGFLLSMFAAMMIADSEAPPRATVVKKDGTEPGKATAPTPNPASDEFELPIQLRVPLTLATLGFVFVALTELGLHYVRQNKAAAAAAAGPGPVVPGSPEHTAMLLEEILKQAEAKKQEAGEKKPEGATASPAGEEKKPEASEKQPESEKPPPSEPQPPPA